MILLDTCAILYDALTPDRLSIAARDAIERADASGALACCDISLWEIAMLVDRGRIDPGTDVASFLDLVLTARSIQVLPITPAIAVLSVSLGLHGDPADRLIAATAVHHGATLLTSDQRRKNPSQGAAFQDNFPGLAMSPPRTAPHAPSLRATPSGRPDAAACGRGAS
ncbi:uncharacterized protein SOCE26_009330 [Sorangium cellulosum]|uniref:Ribonuclease VapC n=2 Tax=Sorangium cellulosum TaxID=56 RepID=A0A2L0EJR6_SORCE|nr:type II toxin-antitoxin system VapC family toxin [Sorangium cellulosum]AUX39540.1 uncharacterized protein SOCE26_009330 [Sorangium cellulosum]